ncbi:MAG: hypothetical protein OEV44_15090, partial [Spirochaetota bacterium]|nr:hypothetical protein [Spirochaetota bacterium]
MRVQINEQIKKQIKEKLKNNSFLPFDYKKLKIGHKIILTIVFIVIFFHFSMISFTTSADNLYEYAKIEFRSKLQGILSNNGFSDKNLKMINFNKLKNSIISIYRPKTKSIKISKKKVNKDQQDNFKLNIDTIIAKLNLIEKMFLEFDRLQKELKANDLYSFLFEIISELRKTENSIDKLTEYDKKLKINKLKSPIINIMLKLIKLETRLKELTFNGRNNNLWVNIFYYKQHLNHLNK